MGKEYNHHYDQCDESHAHRTIEDVIDIINGLNLPKNVKKDIINVYLIIADAESKAHGVPVGEVHFHEVGMLDAIMDIAAFCLIIDKLKPDRILASPICVGFGKVKTQHGTLPVPAPATSYILKDIPYYKGEVRGELCTPTGAALLKYFVDEFTTEPKMADEKEGYGFGKKEFEKPNCVKAILGEEQRSSEDEVYLLECNVDDMTGEEIGRAMEILQDAGAKDVYVTPVFMKKNRPGYMLTVLTSGSLLERMVSLIFKHTSTIGLRETKCERRVLDRKEWVHRTEMGDVREKISEGYGSYHSKYEYEDLKRIAEKLDVSIAEARNIIEVTLQNY